MTKTSSQKAGSTSTERYSFGDPTVMKSQPPAVNAASSESVSEGQKLTVSVSAGGMHESSVVTITVTSRDTRKQEMIKDTNRLIQQRSK